MCGAESEDEGVGLPREEASTCGEYASLACIKGRGVEAAVGEPAVPSVGVVLKIECIVGHILCYGLKDGHRVVEHSEGIDKRRQSALTHSLPDALGEA